MGKIVKYANISFKDNSDSPLGSYIPELGRCRLHMLGVFRLLDNPEMIAYYNEDDDAEGFYRVFRSFLQSKVIDPPAFNYEYSNHRYNVKLGRVGGAKALLLDAHGCRELYVLDDLTRRFYVEGTALDLSEFSDMISIVGTTLNFKDIADYKDEKIVLEDYCPAQERLRVPYVVDNKLDLSDFFGFVSVEGTKLQLGTIAESEDRKLVLETKKGI